MGRILALLLVLLITPVGAQQITGPVSLVSSLKATSVTAANSTMVLPGRSYIMAIAVVNNTGNAITGGLKFGTTSGATDIVVALTVGANATTFIADAAILKRTFLSSQQLFFDAVASFNSANVDVTVYYAPL